MPQKIKYFILMLLMATLVASCTDQQPARDHASSDPTIFILVRHAEKADDGTEDPPLNAVGEARARALTDHLNETRITAVYSTSYKRTQQTVQAIADSSGLTIQNYDPFDESTLPQILEKESGGIVLISGHSNTTPRLVNQLIGEERYEQFEDSDYDNLFIVTTSKVGSGSVIKLTF